MTDPTLDAIRLRHVKQVDKVKGLADSVYCLNCKHPWPCDAVRLLDRLAAVESDLKSRDEDWSLEVRLHAATAARLAQAERVVALCKEWISEDDYYYNGVKRVCGSCRQSEGHEGEFSLDDDDKCFVLLLEQALAAYDAGKEGP